MLLAAFIAIESRSSHPMLDLSLFRKPAFNGVSAVAFGLSAGMFAMFLYLTIYMQGVLGFSPLEAGLRFLPLTVLSFIASPIAGTLSHRIPIRVLLGVGLGTVGVGLMLMHGVSADSEWTALLAGFLHRRRRDRHHQPRHRPGGDRGRAGRESRDGLGDQHDLPPGGDRDRRRRARGDLPVAGRLEARPRLLPNAPKRPRRTGLLRRLPGRRRGDAARARAEVAHAATVAFVSGFNEILLIAAILSFVGRRPRLRPRPLQRLRPAGTRVAKRRSAVAGSSRRGRESVRPPLGARQRCVLRELRIENLLLIERAELRLGEGLNAITGETGAGKTVLAHSLDLLMGGKARPQIVRPGAEEAWVEGVFDLPEGLLGEPELAEVAERLPEGADEVVLGRRVSACGRTSAFVAGRAASASDLKLLGGRLLAFYGQHEHRKLTISSAQMEVLDGFAGAEHLEVRRRYREAHRECGRLAAELAELRERDGSRERDLDLFRYELSEIEEVAPDPAEEAELAAERERLRHAEGLREAAAGAHAGVAGRRRGRRRGGERAGPGGGPAAGSRRRRRRARLDLRAARRARGRAGRCRRRSCATTSEGIEADPGRLAAVEERLDALDRLERKHGGSVESVLAHAERCRAEIERLEGGEERAPRPRPRWPRRSGGARSWASG